MNSGVWRILILVFTLAAVWTFCNADTVQTTEPAVRPGHPVRINVTDPQVEAAAKIAIYAFNNQSNDMFLFKVLQIDDAKMQIVKGIKYILDIRIRRTVCRKNKYYDLDKCDFQNDKKLNQIFFCHSEVWTVVWLHFNKVTALHCQ
ncbi:cystatin-F [Protopterus annectens]|uniref:cystatin-F n=1 Tax=Protopterus annectens TaxID=7888 RepID=UPI001CFB830A|nr:cystatin-F [Protopterus annectens]XP_043913706.1 cystatin-F [Protopterus annectens]XP_043913710.1 cystatin-F [Protopterus annectens]XP_043913711.1 cystatin-F [Protopterus annectens]